MRYRLRTLLILMTLGPPIIGFYVWPKIEARYRAWQYPKQRDFPLRPGGGL